MVDVEALVLLPGSAYFHLQKRRQFFKPLLNANHSYRLPHLMAARKLQILELNQLLLQSFATTSPHVLLLL
jgi:hypothetical protein